MTNVLVTGGLGVIGSTLTRYLEGEGHSVVTSDVSIRDFNDYVRADVTAYEDLHRIGLQYDIKTVIHMGGEVGRMVGETHPQKMVHVNDVGTLNVAQFCLEHNARLIYFSTSEVYGHLLDSGQPVREDDINDKASAFSCTNVYALSKLFGEALVKHSVENYELDAVTVRPFMVYGPGEVPSKWRSAITNFVYNARHSKPLTVHEGTMRAWCHVNDFVRGVEMLVRRETSGTYDAFNIGSDDYHSMREVAELVVQIVGADPSLIETIPVPTRFGSPLKRGNFAKIKALGFLPHVTIEDGIRDVMNWQKDNGY